MSIWNLHRLCSNSGITSIFKTKKLSLKSKFYRKFPSYPEPLPHPELYWKIRTPDQVPMPTSSGSIGVGTEKWPPMRTLLFTLINLSNFDWSLQMKWNVVIKRANFFNSFIWILFYFFIISFPMIFWVFFLFKFTFFHFDVTINNYMDVYIMGVGGKNVNF